MCRSLNMVFRSFLLLFLVLKYSTSEKKYCREAVMSVKAVDVCPMSEKEWQQASMRMKCGELASKQTCSPVEKFKYHCVINPFRNQTLEVCAPEILISGFCTEFNIFGGIIQLHKDAPCFENAFPKCAPHYYSSQAYKYQDCYAVVNKTQGTLSPPTTTETFTTEIFSITTKPEQDSRVSASIIAAAISVPVVIIVFVGIVIAILYRQKKICRRMQRCKETETNVEKEECEELMPSTIESKDLKKTHIEESKADECERKDFERHVIGESFADQYAFTTCRTPGDLRKENLEESKNYLNSYQTFDEFFVETKIYQEVKDIFKKYGVVIWTGPSGCGKTIGAIHLILRHIDENARCIFRRIRSWKELSYVEKDKETIILIDNIFYQKNVDSELEPWWSELEKLHTLFQSDDNNLMLGPLRCIITARTNVIERACQIMERITPILAEHCRMKDNILTGNEKEEILRKQFRFADEKKHISIPEIDESFFMNVRESDGPIGFPLCANLYACSEEYRKPGANFFSRPIKCLKNQIKEEILGDKSNRTKSLFFVLFFYEWHIKMGNYEKLEIKSEHQCRRFLDGVSKDLRKNFEPFDFKGLQIEAQRLLDAFVTNEYENTYKFVHDSVYEAVGDLLCETYVTATAKYFPLDILQNQEYEHATETQKNVLVTRLLYETLSQQTSKVFACKVFRKKSFSDCFVSDLRKKEEQILKTFFTASNESSNTKLPCLFWTSYNNLIYLSEQLYDLVNEKNMCTDYLFYVLLYGECCARKQNLLKTVNGKLRDNEEKIKENVKEFKDEDRSSIIHLLIDSDRSDKFLSGVVERLVKDKFAIDLKNKNNVTPLMLAVKNPGGRKEVITNLITAGAKISSDSKQSNVIHYCVESCNDDETCAEYLKIIFRSELGGKWLSRNDIKGNTALCSAAMVSTFSRICSILMILERCSKEIITTVNENGLSALQLCVKSLTGSSKYTELECCVRVILLLLFGGSPENESDTSDKAIENCKYDVVKDILKHPKDEKNMDKVLRNLFQAIEMDTCTEGLSLPEFSQNIDIQLVESIKQAVNILKNKQLE
uniref:Uncharacterized protein LOC111104457 isoform X2 n=1 Tax=Crassostrea virginica TaxID=6565 RepID=A0A8B8ASH6_CRAVI|nr:uncharacterized protein LOC111104457 isoform X2 [Crassostrea virginica]